jgi:formylglycine-generating enzyme required for sulfatase activity
VRAHASGAIAELRKWFGRNRALSISLCALVACVIAALATVSWVESRGKTEILGFADALRLEELESSARGLGPALPDRVDAYRAWLDEADALLLRRDTHARRLEAMRRYARPDPVTGQAWTFADAEDRWQHAMLASLVSGLDRFGDPVNGRVAIIRRRATFAGEVTQRSLVEHEVEWANAIETISDRAQSPRYKGLAIRPQLGLVPLGPDPKSGLWEFAHLASGEIPTRASDGTLQLLPESGIVLVLVPPGEFMMGSETSREAIGFDPSARADEEPRHEVSVEPCFIAKYELTRAQWSRSVGESGVDRAVALLPVSEVSWPEADESLQGLALMLPTEEQWEFAARADTTTRWSCGDGPGSLRDHANGARSVGEHLPGGRAFEEVKAVGAINPNPFGLHDVHGNVAEWTASAYAPSYDADAPSGPGALRVTRGGSCANSADELRSAARAAVAPRNASPLIGVRAARLLDF